MASSLAKSIPVWSTTEHLVQWELHKKKTSLAKVISWTLVELSSSLFFVAASVSRQRDITCYRFYITCHCFLCLGMFFIQPSVNRA